MKTTFCLLALLALGTLLPAAEPVREAVAALGMLPNQRTGVRIAADERNPFAVKPRDIAKITAPDDAETQESKIRSIFRALQVTGIRRDRNGRFLALVGDLILRQGEEVKPVLEDQTEILIVSKIEARQIELTFVENKDSTQPRVVVLPVRNQVQVEQKLFGQPKGKAGFYVARGRGTPTVEETAAAIAAAPPTAPASASPLATATGTQANDQAQTTARDARREAAALAGLNEEALNSLIGGGATSGNGAVPSSTATPTTTTAPPATTPTATAPAGEMVSPPSQIRRRTSPPGEEPPAQSGLDVLE